MNDYEAELKKMLKPDRFIHSQGVAKTAVKLAQMNGENTEKAYIAGILHDAGKNFSYEEMIKMCEKYSIELDDISKTSTALMHAPLSGEIAKDKFSVSDEEILQSIRCHTVGRENMTLLDKIIYIADMIEPNRDFEGVDEIRKVTFENLNKGVLMGFDTTIQHTIKKGGLLHPCTLYARNSIIKEIKENK